MRSTFILTIICLLLFSLAVCVSSPTASIQDANHQSKIFQSPFSQSEFDLIAQERLLLNSLLLTNKLSLEQKARLVGELKRLDQEFARDRGLRYSAEFHK